MEFHKFDGTGNPLSWLNHYGWFFHVRRTPDDKKVAFTAFYLLDDTQLWFHRMELNGGRPTWPLFVQLINARFGPLLTDSDIGELVMLWRSGTVDKFCKHFIALSCRDTSLTEPQQIQLFITGLGDPLRTDVALQQPASLDNAIISACAYEQRNVSWDSSYQSLARAPNRSSFKPAPSVATSALSPAPASSASASVNKPASSTIRLTLAEIAQRRKDGKCFCCDEFFTNGHKAVCKQLFSIEVLDDDVDETPPDSTEPTISIHALTGIQPRHGRTMQLKVDINGVALLALLDSGSTHNFINIKTAARVGLILTKHGGLCVAVANDDRLSSSRCCRGMQFSIAGEPFRIDCYGLALGSYEMVLGSMA
ncbi:MAG: retropepsin-like aspartic protease [Maritimibacter sp.]